MTVKTTFPTKEDEVRIRERDKVCVYCGEEFDVFSTTKKSTREHLNHRKDWDSVRDYYQKGKDVAEIFAICCQSCNSRRKDKPLNEWFKSKYCIKRGIDYGAVADVVKKYIDRYENE